MLTEYKQRSDNRQLHRGDESLYGTSRVVRKGGWKGISGNGELPVESHRTFDLVAIGYRALK
jgi:hypothetical protein